MWLWDSKAPMFPNQKLLVIAILVISGPFPRIWRNSPCTGDSCYILKVSTDITGNAKYSREEQGIIWVIGKRGASQGNCFPVSLGMCVAFPAVAAGRTRMAQVSIINHIFYCYTWNITTCFGLYGPSSGNLLQYWNTKSCLKTSAYNGSVGFEYHWAVSNGYGYIHW
jgi:hypothetical protein